MGARASKMLLNGGGSRSLPDASEGSASAKDGSSLASCVRAAGMLSVNLKRQTSSLVAPTVTSVWTLLHPPMREAQVALQ